MPEMKIPQETEPMSENTVHAHAAVPPQYTFTPPPAPRAQQKPAGNPLKQYFRRPAIHLRLPSGTKFYTPDVVQYPPTGELPVYPMTAIDEISAKTPDAVFNGAAVADIIHSCVPAITNPWKISTIDLDSILVAIRMASVGQSMEINARCPECSADSDYDVDLSNVLQSLHSGDYTTPMIIDNLEIKFKPLEYSMINEIAQQQFTIQKSIRNMGEMTDEKEITATQALVLKQLNALNLNIMLASIEWIRTPEAVVTEPEYIAEFLQNCQKSDFDLLNKHSVSLRDVSQIKPVHLTCDECNHEYDQSYTVNPSDFFV